jgi:5S rRNA maturation endonuclease (ribonuclease M5)
VLDSRPVLLVEGELDCLLARQELGDLVQAITAGSASDRLPQEVMASLACKEVIVALDADDAGDRNSEELREQLPQLRRL